jgi:uncharacterized protein (TIGR02391 family)
MVRSLPSLIPNADDLLLLPVEQLGGVLLLHLSSFPNGGNSIHQLGRLDQHNFFNDLQRNPPYKSRMQDVNRALLEAWSWLESEGLLARETDTVGAAFFVTRRGQKIKSQTDFDAFRKGQLLPRHQLHPLIADQVYPLFLGGKYDTAIFEAFREIEVTVRAAGNFGPDDYGTDLMREAFRPAEKKGQAIVPGPLTDKQLPIAEQEAMANLFAGAIGLFKNPQSHRHVPTVAEDAAEVIVFASQLLRIIDRVKPPTGAMS